MKEKDEQGLSFSQVTKLLEPLISKQQGKLVTVTPRIVLEVAYEEIQKSTNYSSGYALRFPRIVRLRDDRDENTCSTQDDVVRLFQGQ